jgi:hypothetical protein
MVFQSSGCVFAFPAPLPDQFRAVQISSLFVGVVRILLDKLPLEPGCAKSGWVDQKALRAGALYQGTTLVGP